jgi:hypothetical protein
MKTLLVLIFLAAMLAPSVHAQSSNGTFFSGVQVPSFAIAAVSGTGPAVSGTTPNASKTVEFLPYPGCVASVVGSSGTCPITTGTGANALATSFPLGGGLTLSAIGSQSENGHMDLLGPISYTVTSGSMVVLYIQ